MRIAAATAVPYRMKCNVVWHAQSFEIWHLKQSVSSMSLQTEFHRIRVTDNLKLWVLSIDAGYISVSRHPINQNLQWSCQLSLALIAVASAIHGCDTACYVEFYVYMNRYTYQSFPHIYRTSNKKPSGVISRPNNNKSLFLPLVFLTGWNTTLKFDVIWKEKEEKSQTSMLTRMLFTGQKQVITLTLTHHKSGVRASWEP